MNDSTPKLMVAVADSTVFLKVTGRADFKISVEFKKLVNELCQRGYDRFVLELTDCLVMDSTFLGMLAGFGQRMAQAPSGEAKPRIQLCNTNPRITDLLDNLGVTHLFHFACGAGLPAQKFEAVPANPQAPSKEEVSRACLEAHLTLMDINPANIPKFKDVTRFLAEDLEKL